MTASRGQQLKFQEAALGMGPTRPLPPPDQHGLTLLYLVTLPGYCGGSVLPGYQLM